MSDEPRWKTRRRILTEVLEERFDGKLRDLAEAIDRSESYVWQLIRGKQPRFGEDAARYIETKLHLPPRMLDGGDEALHPADEHPQGDLTEAELNQAWESYSIALKTRIVETIRAARDTSPAPRGTRPKEEFAPASLKRRRKRGGEKDLAG